MCLILLVTETGNQQLVTSNQQPCLSSKTLVKSPREYEILRFCVIFGLC